VYVKHLLDYGEPARKEGGGFLVMALVTVAVAGINVSRVKVLSCIKMTASTRRRKVLLMAKILY
jgi:hypothetical protein